MGPRLRRPTFCANSKKAKIVAKTAFTRGPSTSGVHQFRGPSTSGAHQFRGPTTLGANHFMGPQLRRPTFCVKSKKAQIAAKTAFTRGPSTSGVHQFKGPSTSGAHQFRGPTTLGAHHFMGPQLRRPTFCAKLKRPKLQQKLHLPGDPQRSQSASEAPRFCIVPEPSPV